MQADALTVRLGEGVRTVIVHGLIAVGVNADGHREILGFEVCSTIAVALRLNVWDGADNPWGESAEAGFLHQGLTLELVYPLVVRDLPEHVCE